MSAFHDITTNNVLNVYQSNLFQSHVAVDNLVDLILWIQINLFRQMMTVNVNTVSLTRDLTTLMSWMS